MNSTPRLSRKNSGSRRKKSEDKISLVDAAASDDEDEAGVTDRLTPISADSRSRNSSLRNFDLLQVPGNEGVLHTISTDAAVSLVSFDMDNSYSNADVVEVLKGSSSSKSLGPLTLQIPDQHMTPTEANKNCNGNVTRHPTLIRMNGGPANHGEHTPLLISPVKAAQNGSIISNNGIFKRTASLTSLDMDDSDSPTDKMLQTKLNHGSLYSRLNGKNCNGSILLV